MEKTFKMSIYEIKHFKKSLISILVISVITILLAIFTRSNEAIHLLILAVADLLEKLIIPFFIYFGAKSYKTSLKNTLQSGETRYKYFISKFFSIIMVSIILSLIITPISYYLARMGSFDTEGFVMPILLGIFNPVIPTMYSYASVIEITIITILIYTLFASVSFLTVALFNKIGGIRLFLINIMTIFILTFLNNLLTSRFDRPDFLDVILGFSGASVNLITPMFSLTLLLTIILSLTYYTIKRTEV